MTTATLEVITQQRALAEAARLLKRAEEEYANHEQCVTLAQHWIELGRSLPR